MAQNSRYGGPSITAEEAADPSPPSSRPIRVRRPEMGTVDRVPYVPDVAEGEPLSVGGSSKSSMPKQSTSEEKQSGTPRKPARMTGNHSKVQESAKDSTVPSTDGVGPSNVSKPSDDPFGDF